MSKSDKKISYTEYREKIISSLVNRRTWQELISNPNNYPFELPLQLKAMQDYNKTVVKS